MSWDEQTHRYEQYDRERDFGRDQGARHAAVRNQSTTRESFKALLPI